MSFKIPKWFGVYHSSKSNFGEPTGITFKHLKFNIRWSLWRHFAQVYILMMLQFCNASPETVPVSAVIGIVFGFIVFYGVYVGRTKWREQKKWIALCLAGTISVFASLALTSGVYYIDTVWKRDTGIDVATLIAISFFCWLLGVCLPVHALLWHNTKRKVAECTALGKQYSYKYKTKMFEPAMFAKIQQQPTQGDDNHKDGAPGEIEDTANASSEESGDNVQIKVNECTADTKADSPLGKEEDDGVAVDAVGDDNDENEITNDNRDENDKEERTEKEDEEDVLLKQVKEMEQTETTWRLISLHCWGRAETQGEREPKTCLEKLLSLCKWTIALVVNGLFLYLVIVNIGATQQMAIVRAHLPPAFEFLYPPEYNVGPMCAWSEPTENATIQTFATAQDAYNANYTIVHCGACGSCSTWNDLRIQWTTRSVLAKMGQECAKESFFGTFDDVHKCNMEYIGFYNDCALCWTEDELCAKKHCVFIYLQGVMINNIANFNVGLEHITSASCDEAMCGPVFVPCSGATRRRMNIVSGIPRPMYQQCTVVEQDWATVFNHP